MAAAAAAAGAAAALIEAKQVYGATIWVGIEQFLNLLARQEEPLVVFHESPGLFMKQTSYWYLTSYKGFVFYTSAYNLLQLPERAEVITTPKLWLPRVIDD